MVAKEQHMSEAKRDHSVFNHTAAAARAFARTKPARQEQSATPNFADLRVLENWEIKLVPSGDPYNGIGARAIGRKGPRK
jgi:hypothetical protein